MRQIELKEPRKHLSRLVDEAAAGDVFVITIAGKSLVKVLPVDQIAPLDDKRVKRIGFMEGMIRDVPDDFDRLFDDEIARMFGVTDHKPT